MRVVIIVIIGAGNGRWEAGLHQVRIPDHIIERVIQRRGKLHVYDRLNRSTTAFVVIDMQNVFAAPGMPLEVPRARHIVQTSTGWPAPSRDGAAVVWVQIMADAKDWPATSSVSVPPSATW